MYLYRTKPQHDMWLYYVPRVYDIWFDYNVRIWDISCICISMFHDNSIVNRLWCVLVVKCIWIMTIWFSACCLATHLPVCCMKIISWWYFLWILFLFVVYCIINIACTCFAKYGTCWFLCRRVLIKLFFTLLLKFTRHLFHCKILKLAETSKSLHFIPQGYL